MTSLATLSIAWLLITGSTAATPSTLDVDLARASDVIVTGRVVAVATAWDADTIYTYVTLEVGDIWNGWIPERRITLKQLGGRVGDTALVIDDQAFFDIDEQVVAFLSIRRRDGTLKTTGLSQGKWTIARDAQSGEPFATRPRRDGLSRTAFGALEARPLAALRVAARAAPAARIDAHLVVDPREARSASPVIGVDATRFFQPLPSIPAEQPASRACFTQFRAASRWSATTDGCGEIEQGEMPRAVAGTWLLIGRRLEALKAGVIGSDPAVLTVPALNAFSSASWHPTPTVRPSTVAGAAATVQTTRVSVASDGSQLGGDSASPAISPNGRRVVFTFNRTIVAIHDNETGVSTAIGSTTTAPRFTSDGKNVMYLDATTGKAAAYDVTTGTTRTLNVPSTAVTDDLRYGAYTAGYSATGSYSNVRDLQTDVDTPIPSTGTTTGSFPWADVAGPVLSPTGRYVAYHGYNFNPVFLGEKIFTWVWDRSRDVLILLGEGLPVGFTRDERFLLLIPPFFISPNAKIVDLVSGEATPLPLRVGTAAISANGRFVTMVDDTSAVEHVFVFDRTTNQTLQVDVNAAGAPGDASASGAVVDDSGRVAYASAARNLVPNDTNGASDIFLASGGSATAVPGPPVGLSGFPLNNLVTLSWRAPVTGGAPTTYVIEAGSAPGLADVANFETGNVSTSFSTSVILTTAVYVRVRGANAAGVGPPSNETVLMPPFVPLPNAPTSLVATVSGGTVTLTWQPDANGPRPTGYYIRAGSSRFASDLANFSVGNVTQYTATDVPPGTYYVRVFAVNAAGLSGGSNEVVASVASAQPCNAAPAPPVSIDSAVSGSTVTLTWLAAVGFPTSYVVEAGAARGLADLASFETGNSATSLTVSGVGPGSYWVRVRGRNACGIGSSSPDTFVSVR